jgi:hypothetical protein
MPRSMPASPDPEHRVEFGHSADNTVPCGERSPGPIDNFNPLDVVASWEHQALLLSLLSAKQLSITGLLCTKARATYNSRRMIQAGEVSLLAAAVQLTTIQSVKRRIASHRLYATQQPHEDTVGNHLNLQWLQ